MWSAYFYPFILGFITHHRFIVTPLLSLALAFFYSDENKLLPEPKWRDVNLLSLRVSSESLLGSCHILPLLLPIVSEDNTHLPHSHIQKTPTQGF